MTATADVRDVGFREATVRRHGPARESRAGELGLTGWVRHGEDGTVRLHAEGDPQALEGLAQFLHDGPARARVTSVEVEDSRPEGHEQFAIRGVSAGAFVVQEHAATAHHFDLRLWAQDGELVLAFSFDEQLHAAARGLPERHYDPKQKCWRAPATAISGQAVAQLASALRVRRHRPGPGTLGGGRRGAMRRRRGGSSASRTTGASSCRPRRARPTGRCSATFAPCLIGASIPSPRTHPRTGPWLTTPTASRTSSTSFDVHGDRLHISAANRALLGAERAEALDASADVNLGSDGFELAFDYDAAIVEQVKAITGREFDRARRVWTVPKAVRPALQLASLLAATRLTINDEAAQALHELRLEADRRAAQQIHLFDLSLAHDADLQIPAGFAIELRPFQRAGVQYILTARRTLVADSQGLGKTLECLAGIHADNAFPALIVAPATLKLSWRDEAQRALPDRRTVVLGGEIPDAAALENAEIAIVNYDVLQAWLKTLRKVPRKALVGDEGHKLKEQGHMKNQQLRGPARSYAFQRLAGAVTRRSGLVLLATATPVVNKSADLVNELRILDQLAEFGGSQGFKQRFCDPQPTDHGTRYDGASNLEELNTLLRARCMVRRHKRDVLKDLPPKQRTLVRLPLPDKEARRYRRAHDDVVAFLRDDRAQQARLSLPTKAWRSSTPRRSRTRPAARPRQRQRQNVPPPSYASTSYARSSPRPNWRRRSTGRRRSWRARRS